MPEGYPFSGLDGYAFEASLNYTYTGANTYFDLMSMGDTNSGDFVPGVFGGIIYANTIDGIYNTVWKSNSGWINNAYKNIYIASGVDVRNAALIT